MGVKGEYGDIVADGGMISAEAITGIEQRNWSYILGVRMRQSKEAKQQVLTRGGRYEQVHPPRGNSKAPAPL